VDKQTFLAQQPRIPLLGTPWQKDPTRCKHTLVMFKGTAFRDDPGCHKIVQIFQCQDCGAVHKEFRDVRSAGRRGAIDIDDPRVLRTLIYNKDVDRRYFSEYGQFNEDPGKLRYIGRGMDVA
jgi:hypothetical protein